MVSDKAVEAVADGDAGEFLGADIGGAQRREHSRLEVRVSQEDVIAESEPEHGVADELEALVGLERLAVVVRGVSECFY